MIWLSLSTVNAVAEEVPKVTALAPVKFEPVIVTDVPPATGPVVGESEVTTGRSGAADAGRAKPQTTATSNATIARVRQGKQATARQERAMIFVAPSLATKSLSPVRYASRRGRLRIIREPEVVSTPQPSSAIRRWLSGASFFATGSVLGRRRDGRYCRQGAAFSPPNPLVPPPKHSTFS